MNSNKSLNILYIGNMLSVHGYTPTNIETLGPKLEGEGYYVQYASSKKNKIVRLIDMCRTIVRSRDTVDVVLIDTYSTVAFYFAYLCVWVCKQFNIPYVPILHGGNLPNRIKNSPKLSAKIFDHSYNNVVVSPYIQQSLIAAGFKNKLIANYIEIGNYTFLHRQNAQPNLLWVRSFDEIYNPTLAVHVVKALSENFPNIKLTMIGPDKDGSLEKCKQLSKEVGVADNIEFTGRLTKEEWTRRSAAHSVFINTTNFDNLPVSIIEAMALGIPVVSTNVGGVPFLVADGVDGLLVPPNDKDAMVAAITNLLEHPESVASISTAARKKAEQYDWAIIKEQWRELFNGLSKNNTNHVA